MNGSRLPLSGLTLRLADGHKVLIWLEEAHELVGPDAASFHPDRNIAGHPTDWLDADPRGLWSPSSVR